MKLYERTEGYKLQEAIDEKIFPKRNLSLSEFAKRVLLGFDIQNERLLHYERTKLAEGSTSVADTNLPLGYLRTVLREALADLKILEIVQALVDPKATSTTGIPYEKRSLGSIQNQGIVFEGNPMPMASITQDMELAYMLPMKLGFEITNEVLHFSKNSPLIEWDAYQRNVNSNARVLRELIALRVSNELQRAADAFGAQDVANEAFDTQLTGSNSIIKTVEFPIVRPFTKMDLQGNVITSTVNPITVTLNDVVISEHDGTGQQSAGTYYRVINYNLGYIQLVDESGTPVTPADAGVNTISYSYATNVQKFDTDNGSTDIDVHLNGLLRAIGSRKAVLAQDRFARPDFLLMSYILHDTVSNAKQFGNAESKSGTNLGPEGDLGRVKGTGAWATNTAGTDLGDERIIMGERQTVSYVVGKPLTTSGMFEHVDPSTGRPTGKKQSYVEEYNAITVPTEIRGRLTSVLAYSFSGR